MGRCTFLSRLRHVQNDAGRVGLDELSQVECPRATRRRTAPHQRVAGETTADTVLIQYRLTVVRHLAEICRVALYCCLFRWWLGVCVMNWTQRTGLLLAVVLM